MGLLARKLAIAVVLCVLAWAPPLWAVLAPFPIGIGWLCLQYVAELYKLLRAHASEANT